jgi:hypothetical protein
MASRARKRRAKAISAVTVRGLYSIVALVCAALGSVLAIVAVDHTSIIAAIISFALLSVTIWSVVRVLGRDTE